jgi:hypothetical protein
MMSCGRMGGGWNGVVFLFFALLYLVLIASVRGDDLLQGEKDQYGHYLR